MQALPGLRDPLVTYHLTATRPRAAAQRPRPARAADARGRCQRGATRRSAVPRSCAAAPTSATMQHRFAITKASVMTVHLCSTVPLGERPRPRGADSFGRVHGTANVWVNDASLLPDRPRRQPAGHGDGVRHPQRPALRRGPRAATVAEPLLTRRPSSPAPAAGSAQPSSIGSSPTADAGLRLLAHDDGSGRAAAARRPPRPG